MCSLITAFSREERFPRNAIKLLGVMGYDPKLIEKAQNMADHFLETGEWRQEEA